MNKKDLLTIDRLKVTSSNINTIGYKDQYLIIEFKGGKIYSYHPITQQCFEELRTAESVGKYFASKIKSNENVTTQQL